MGRLLLALLLLLAPAALATPCGDGIVDADELCDDGNLWNGDGCSSECDLCQGDDTSGDNDADGYCRLDEAGMVLDCDDGDPSRAPWAEELCNGLDDDCDGSPPLVEDDADGDGWRGCQGDCDDEDAFVSPAGSETCNGKDDNCDGLVDPDCIPALAGGTSGCLSDLGFLPLGLFPLFWKGRRGSLGAHHARA